MAYTYGSWSRIGQGAGALLKDMIRASTSSSSSLSSLLLMNDVGDENDDKSDNDDEVAVLTSTVVFNALIYACSRSGNKDVGTRAKNMLEQMKEDVGIALDVISYNSVIKKWSNLISRADAAVSAESEFRLMSEEDEG